MERNKLLIKSKKKKPSSKNSRVFELTSAIYSERGSIYLDLDSITCIGLIEEDRFYLDTKGGPVRVKNSDRVQLERDHDRLIDTWKKYLN